MSEHSAEWAQLRVGARVTLRDWRGDSVAGDAFLSPAGAWLMRTRMGSVFPVMPRELIRVENGADAMYSRLQEGALVTFADWEGGKVEGVAHHTPGGVWEAKDKDGARWLIEPYRLMSVSP